MKISDNSHLFFFLDGNDQVCLGCCFSNICYYLFCYYLFKMYLFVICVQSLEIRGYLLEITFSTLLVLEIELRLQGLAASSFTCCMVFLSPLYVISDALLDLNKQTNQPFLRSRCFTEQGESALQLTVSRGLSVLSFVEALGLPPFLFYLGIAFNKKMQISGVQF